MAKILIVDDERPIRRILGMLLTDHGHQVTEAGSGEEALGKVTSFAPDLALLDLRLPGMDGLETLAELLRLQPQLDVLMMTAHGTIRSAVEAMKAGAFDYITKPFDNDEVLLLLNRALRVRRLNTEVEELRDELEARYGFNEIIGISPAFQAVFRTMAKVARVDATVLVTGESGTGKELVARAIHRRSPRNNGPFVAVNCSAIPATLIESEFFGHEKGAFTDARDSRPGKFEQADSGTLFLDEAGDLAPEAQAKLLRTLQDRQVTRIGARASREVDVRVIAATNKDLEQAVRAGEFREDLYWRLNVVHIELPPLRQRREDLPLLFDHFLQRYNRELGLAIQGIETAAKELLLSYAWPGNVRELENTLCRSMVLAEGASITAEDLPPRLRGEQRLAATGGDGAELEHLGLAEAVREATERLEKRMILARLSAQRGNRTATAESLGVSRKTLFNKMRQLGLTAEAGDEG